ncbi:MAG: VanZ family protein [Syntrophaceae bacterium]
MLFRIIRKINRKLFHPQIQCYFGSTQGIKPDSEGTQVGSTPSSSSEEEGRREEGYFRRKSAKFIGVIFFSICLIMLVVGLWPFDFKPVNKVSWLNDRNGVNFYGQAMITSPLLWDDPQYSLFQNKAITIELMLRPSSGHSDVGIGRILSFYDGYEPDVLFLGQWRSHLVIWSRMQIIQNRFRKPVRRENFRDVGLSKALPKDTDQFLTITSGGEGTAIYINGKIARAYKNYNILSRFTGTPCQLILGNSPNGTGYWTGDFSGIAIYNQTLTPSQVSKSYQEWIDKGAPSTTKDDECIALYLFNERKGAIVYNHMDNGSHLSIPEVFKPLRRTILSAPWVPFNWDRSSLQDISINIVGFVPFGFFCAIFLCKKKLRKNNIYLTSILFGLGFSLAIELLQVYLPTRHSQLMDVICNLMGTIIGLIIFDKTFLSSLDINRN